MDNHPAPIAAAVYRWYTARGVRCRFAPDAPGELTSIGRPDSDAARQLLWLSRQVAPVVNRLLGCYSESDLYAVLFGGVDAHGIQPVRSEADNELSAYDRWQCEREAERRSWALERV